MRRARLQGQESSSLRVEGRHTHSLTSAHESTFVCLCVCVRVCARVETKEEQIRAPNQPLTPVSFLRLMEFLPNVWQGESPSQQHPSSRLHPHSPWGGASWNPPAQSQREGLFTPSDVLTPSGVVKQSAAGGRDKTQQGTRTRKPTIKYKVPPEGVALTFPARVFRVGKTGPSTLSLTVEESERRQSPVLQ